MANGAAAVALPLPVDPPIAPITADAPAAVEQRIGAAIADAAAAIAIGLSNCAETGRISAGVKERGGEALAEAACIALAHFGEFDFDRVARREGRKTLEVRHRTMLQAHLPAATVDAVFSDLIGQALLIVKTVVDDERALAH